MLGLATLWKIIGWEYGEVGTVEGEMFVEGKMFMEDIIAAED